MLQTVGECRGRALSPKLLIALTGTKRQGDGFASLFENVDSATPGKPCVQNDMRVRSKLEEKPRSLKCGATNAKIRTALV